MAMTDPPKAPDPTVRSVHSAVLRAARRERFPEITRWKRILLGLAALCVVVGGALALVGGAESGSGDAPSTSGTIPGNTLVGEGGIQVPGTGEVDTEAGVVGWSPFFLKGGFSFFVAFCVGFAMRVWLRISAVILGTFFLGVFLLDYFGAIHVDWITIEGWWSALTHKVSAEASDFHTFLTGSLPQVGMAGIGLVAGFKRR